MFEGHLVELHQLHSNVGGRKLMGHSFHRGISLFMKWTFGYSGIWLEAVARGILTKIPQNL
jgi:hypothetical protein